MLLNTREFEGCNRQQDDSEDGAIEGEQDNSALCISMTAMARTPADTLLHSLATRSRRFWYGV